MCQFKQKDFKCLSGEAGSSTFFPPEPTELTLICRDRRRTPQPEEITHRTRVCCTNSTTPSTSDSPVLKMWVLWPTAGYTLLSVVCFLPYIHTTKTDDMIDRMVMIQCQGLPLTCQWPSSRKVQFFSFCVTEIHPSFAAWLSKDFGECTQTLRPCLVLGLRRRLVPPISATLSYVHT